MSETINEDAMPQTSPQTAAGAHAAAEPKGEPMKATLVYEEAREWNYR